MTPASPVNELRARARPVPRFDRWPEAVRSAELLRGSLVRCGPGVRGAGWPETPRVRAAALAPWLTSDRIAIRMSAAWIWGAARRPDAPLELSTADRRRPDHGPHRDHLLHQFAYDRSALRTLDGFAVTEPEQTVYDLLRMPHGFARRHLVACRLLVRLVPDGRAGIADRLERQHSHYRALARSRLARL
ncbi:hypothetical protein [Leucobacter sp.]